MASSKKAEKYSLVGVDGNAFSVMGYVADAMKKEGFSAGEVKEYRKEATAGDYDNLLAVSLSYVQKCNERRFAEESECFDGGSKDGLFQPIPFSRCRNMSDGNCVVLTGVTFEYVEGDLKQVDDFFHEIGLIPADKHVVNLRRITGNVLGDEGRTDVLACFDECMPNPMARLRAGHFVKWTSDFVDNYNDDYNG